jgi:Gas vesicle protein G
MFIVDDVLMAPINGVFWVFDEIRKAAEQELANESEALTLELQQLYAMLEAGKITEAEFDQREAELLDRLDAIRERGAVPDEDERDEDEDEE